MATISNTPRPGYVWDSTDNVWYPIGVGAHQHTNAADTPAVMPYSTYAAAGKNKIINGDFTINQRNFTSATGNGEFGFDRWKNNVGSSGGTSTFTSQTFTPGAAPITGYEGATFAQIISASQSGVSDWSGLLQNIEDVRTFAGQTVTVSFWAKAASGTPKVGVTFEQAFGPGGSAAIYTSATALTISTSWARYSVSIALPSLTGKTIAPGNRLGLYIFNSTGSTLTSLNFSNTGLQNGTFQYWGIQVEAGSNATAFQTATGNPASELAACQRYYYRAVADTAYGSVAPYAVAASSSGFIAMIQPPATMRVSPTSIDFSTLAFVNYADTLYAVSSLTLPANNNKQVILVSGSMTGATAGHAGRLTGNNSTAAYLGFSAEL